MIEGKMTSTEPRPRAPHKGDELIGIAFATTIAVLALVYTLVPFIPVLVAWESVALVYLVLLFTRFRNRTTRGVPAGSRALPGKILEYLSWALPIAASGTGVTAAVTLLTTEGSSGTGGAHASLVGLLGCRRGRDRGAAAADRVCRDLRERLREPA